MLGLFLILSKKTNKILKRKPQKPAEKNPEEAQKCIDMIKDIAQDFQIDSGIDPEKMRERIISLYTLLIAANTHLGFHRNVDMTPDEYQAQYSRIAPQRTDEMGFVTKVYSHVFFGNQLPNISQYQNYINAVRHSILTFKVLS